MQIKKQPVLNKKTAAEIAYLLCFLPPKHQVMFRLSAAALLKRDNAKGVFR